MSETDLGDENCPLRQNQRTVIRRDIPTNLATLQLEFSEVGAPSLRVSDINLGFTDLMVKTEERDRLSPWATAKSKTGQV